MDRKALLHSLASRIAAFVNDGDELAVLDGFVARLEKGRASYGAPLDLDDGREWDAEADEELADYGVYRAFKRTSERRRRDERLSAMFDTSEVA